MVNEQARVSLLAHGTEALACELCTSRAKAPEATVVNQHPRGGTVQLAACDFCVRALRRLAAGSGGHAVFALAEGGVPSPPGRRLRSGGARPRADGTWEGWIEFVAIGEAAVLRTDQETTQSNREGVAYWASGLEPSYIEGAFARTQRDAPAVMPA